MLRLQMCHCASARDLTLSPECLLVIDSTAPLVFLVGFCVQSSFPWGPPLVRTDSCWWILFLPIGASQIEASEQPAWALETVRRLGNCPRVCWEPWSPPLSSFPFSCALQCEWFLTFKEEGLAMELLLPRGTGLYLSPRSCLLFVGFLTLFRCRDNSRLPGLMVAYNSRGWESKVR